MVSAGVHSTLLDAKLYPAMSTSPNQVFSIGIQIQGIRSNGDPASIYIAEALTLIQDHMNMVSVAAGQSSSSSTSTSAPSTQQLMGTLDGVNNVFTVSTVPSIIAIFRNGVYLDGQSTTPDYTISGATITFSAFSIPQPNDKLWALIWS